MNKKKSCFRLVNNKESARNGKIIEKKIENQTIYGLTQVLRALSTKLSANWCQNLC